MRKYSTIARKVMKVRFLYRVQDLKRYLKMAGIEKAGTEMDQSDLSNTK